MKKILIALVLLTVTIQGQEIITLTTPVVVNRTSYHLSVLHADFDNGILAITLADNTTPTSNTISCSYNVGTNPTGAFLLAPLQKANMSSAYAANATTGSLKQRVYHRLVVMGEASTVCGQALTGTLTGTVP